MPKVVNNKTKCAEIYCIELVGPQFHIICTCGKSMVEYEAFCEHFHREHLLNTSNVANFKDLEQKHKLPTSNDDCLKEPLLPLLPSTDSDYGNDDDTLTTNLQPEQNTKCNRNKERNVCSYCGRSFRRRHLLDTHLNIHTGRKPHQCEMCGKQFRAVSTLMRHLRTHEERAEQRCQHCDKQFTHRSALLSHELRHTQVRRFACGSCNKCFYTRNQMDTHRRKLHEMIAGTTDSQSSCHLPFACELCEKSYRSASMLSTHKLKQHYRFAKYACEQCDKKFVDAERLQQHQLIHKKPEVLIK